MPHSVFLSEATARDEAMDGTKFMPAIFGLAQQRYLVAFAAADHG